MTTATTPERYEGLELTPQVASDVPGRDAANVCRIWPPVIGPWERPPAR